MAYSGNKDGDKYNQESELLESALEKFEASKTYFNEQYKQGREDLSFLLGDQWPEEIRRQRQNQKRPILTENRLQSYVHKVVNEIRQQKPTIIARPADSGADEDTAEIIKGVIRNIESISDAESAYDMAAYNAVSTGMGFVRICTDYVNEESFDQEIIIDRIVNPWSVYIDPTAQRKDYSDMEYAFVYEDIPKEKFKKMYPDFAPDGFDVGNEDYAEWLTENTVRVAEYFYKERETKTLYKYMDELGNEVTGLELPEGVEAIEKRDTEVCNVKYCKMTVNHILEEGEFPSKYIPIVPVLGFETFKMNKRFCYSLINQAKDPQRLFNIWKSASAEIIALQPKAPWVGAVGSFNDPKKWADSNNQAPAFLEYNPVAKDGRPVPPPQRQPVPQGSPAMFQEQMAAAQGIQSVLGIYDASIGKETNDISGKAIISRQLQSETSTYHFTDNLTTALQQVGRIIIDMIPFIYSGARIVRILGEDGVTKMIPVNQPAIKVEKGNYRPAMGSANWDANYKLDAGKYDVVVDVGPSHQTKRQEAANSLIELSKTDPRVLELTADLIVENLDIPNKDSVVNRIRSVMDPSLLEDDVMAAKLQQAQQSLQAMESQLEQMQAALQAKEQNQDVKNQIELAKVENDSKEIEMKAMQTMADIRKTQAETEKLLKEANTAIPAEAMKGIMDAMSKMGEEVEDIGGAVEVLIQERESVPDDEEGTEAP